MLTRQRFSLNNSLLRVLIVAGSEKLVLYIFMRPHQLRAISSSQITLPQHDNLRYFSTLHQGNTESRNYPEQQFIF